MANTIIPKATLSPTPTLLSDDEISERTNAAIADAQAKKQRSAYLDIGLDAMTVGRAGDAIIQRALTLLAEKGYHNAALDGRSCQIEIPL